jgi:hypothetical protein
VGLKNENVIGKPPLGLRNDISMLIMARSNRWVGAPRAMNLFKAIISQCYPGGYGSILLKQV